MEGWRCRAGDDAVGRLNRRALRRGTSDAHVQRQVISRVVETQSLQVDTVSGATVTTRAALKAIENALSAAR
jgi:uncharacterized protein with FMN-binding domain